MIVVSRWGKRLYEPGLCSEVLVALTLAESSCRKEDLPGRAFSWKMIVEEFGKTRRELDCGHIFRVS